MKRLISMGLVVSLAGVIFAFGCAKKTVEEIKIGVITPLTGDGASYGEETKRGVDLAVEEINQTGGIKGKKIRLIYEDDQLKPEAGTNVIRKLINIDKIAVIIGAFGSSVTLAIAPIAEKSKVVLFSASSTADVIKDAGDYIFRNVPPNSAQGKTAAEFAVNKLKVKTAGVLYMNNDYGISLAEAFKEFFKQKKGTVLIVENYSQGDTDFRTQLLKIKEKNPDIIFYPGLYQESGLILKQAKEIGIKSTFIGGDGSYSPELSKIAGTAAEDSFYTLMGMGYGIADEEIDRFSKTFKKKYGVEPGVYSAYAYDALKVIAQAVKEGGYSADGIKDALYSIKDFKGVTGLTSFDKFGEVDKPYAVYIVRDGKFELFKE